MSEEKNGFTLIELLVVIAIIGILASIVLISLNSATAKARDAKRVSDIRTIYIILEMYYADYEHYPNCTEYGGCDWIPEPGTSADTSRDGVFMNFLIPYFSNGKIPFDPINNADYFYVYNTGEYPVGSGVLWDFCILTRLEDPNNPVLKLDIDIGGNPMWNGFFKICRKAIIQ